jgi:hypothetical protein
MYNNNCGIYNHGISGDASSGNAYMNYSIKRNESYIRRQLHTTTPGGVQTRIFVNPNGNTAYSPVAFNLGYFTAFNQSVQGVIGNNGGDVNTYPNWLIPIDLYRLLGESTNVQQLADDMFANSINGANYWAPIFTHSIVSQYPLADFHADFNYIANTYGRDGLDNVWVASEEEIISYLRVKEATILDYNLIGNNLVILLSGSIPSDMRFYPLSLLINADATITNITITGGTNTFNGIGQTSSLINLEWNGKYVVDSVELADTYVTIAEQTQTLYDCWIAMDYVYMVAPGPDRTLLRDRLCAIDGVTYDPGFCQPCDFTIGNDTAICLNDCIDLSAPFAAGNTYLWSEGSTTQTINVCPTELTDYWVRLTTSDGCIAYDTIQVNVLPVPVIDLGANDTICLNECIDITAPFAEGNTYLWSNDSTTQTISVCPLALTEYWVQVTSPNGCVASDTIQINVLPSPILDLGNDVTICLNDCIDITAPFAEGYTYLWSNDSTTQTISVCPADTTTYWLRLTNTDGCSASDTIQVNTLPLPVFDLGPDQQICLGDTAILSGPDNDNYTYKWFANNNLLQNESGVQLSYITNDTVLIRLEVLDQNGCMFADSSWVFALELPLIQVTPATASLCFGESVSLQITAQNATGFSWWDGSTAQTRVFQPTQSNFTYRLWAMAINGFGCHQYDTAVIQVFDNPSFQLSVSQGNDTICVEESLTLKVSLTSAVPIQSLIWNETDTIENVTGTDHFKTISPTQSSWYTVKIVSNNDCIDQDSIYIRVVPLPVMTITDDKEICFGESVTIEATGGQSCAWYVEGALISDVYSFIKTPLITTTYVAVITGEGAIPCISTDSVTIFVHPKPIVIPSIADTSICAGSDLVISASGAVNYLWSDAQTGDTIHVSPIESTLYEVIGATDYGCSDTAQTQVTVFPVQEVSFSGLLPVYCLNDSPSQLTGIPPGGLFSGPGTIAGRFNPSIAGDGIHLITYSLTDENNCTSSYSLETRVFGGVAQIDLGPDSTICPNDFVLLDAGIGFTEYFWSNGQTTQTAIISGTDYPAGTSRDISVVGVLNGCTASGSMTLTIRNDCFDDINDHPEAKGISIVPNPNDGAFKLKFSKLAQAEKLVISTIGGINIYTYRFPLNSQIPEEMNIQLPGILNGVFIVTFQTHTAVYTSKLIIR